MTSPIPISVLYSAQFLAVAVVVLLTQLYVGVLYVISGLAVGIQGLPPAEIFYWLLRGSLGGLSIAALQLFLSSFIRSFAVPIAIALLAGVGGLAVVNTDYRMFLPLLPHAGGHEFQPFGGSARWTDARLLSQLRSLPCALFRAGNRISEEGGCAGVKAHLNEEALEAVLRGQPAL